MRVLVLGAGGVGSAVAGILAKRRSVPEVVFADYDLARAQRAADIFGAGATAIAIDASSESDIVAAIAAHRIDLVLNAVDPRFVMPIFRACLAAQVHYMDMAMSLSTAHPTEPFATPGVMLGDEQFALADAYAATGKMALVGMGVEPGMSDVFARYAADELFSEIHEAGVRDGSNLTVDGYDFAPSFSIWTVIEECLNPPLIF